MRRETGDGRREKQTQKTGEGRSKTGDGRRPPNPINRRDRPPCLSAVSPRRADGQTSQNLTLFFDAFLGKIVETIA